MLAADGFDRQIDLAVVKIRSAAPVALLAVEVAIRVILDEIAVAPAQFEVTGNPLGKVYNLRCKGAITLAAARAS